MVTRCEICKGKYPDAVIVKHHIIPKSLSYPDRDIYNPVAKICANCHKLVHALAKAYYNRYKGSYGNPKDATGTAFRRLKEDYNEIISGKSEWSKYLGI